MAQATDIVLDGAGYMIEPGSPQSPGYKRLQDGHPEGLTQRTTLTDFFGGQRRALQLERDTFYDSLAIGPALGGQGVRPWPLVAYRTGANYPSFANAITRDTYVPQVIANNRSWFAVGKQLIRGPVTTRTGTWSWSVAHTFTHDITDITIYGSIGILVCFGSAADIIFYHTGTGTTATLMAGERGHRIEAYNGFAIWTDARTNATPTILRMVKGTGIDTRHVSYDVTAMATVGGELMLITKQALFTFRGRVRDVMVNNPGWTSGGSQPAQIPGQEWSGDFEPFYQQGVVAEEDDYRVMLGYGGRTLAWIAGGMHELVPSGDRAGWRSTGLAGRRCFGGTVAAGYVWVSIESHSSQNEIWCYNGTGWWCVARQPMPEPGSPGAWCSPINLGRTNWTSTVFFLIEGETNKVLDIRPVDMRDGINTLHFMYPPTAEFVTPMIDAGDRDKIKAWRKIGAVFSSPELQGNITSGDNVRVDLDYSTDAGATWTTVFSEYSQVWAGSNGNSLAAMNFDIEEALQGVVSRFIQLRIRWVSVSDWAPILTGVWVEHETFQSPARRRKWQLRIHARDQEIDRDGVVLTRTGRELIEDLWQAWESDTPLTFRDIDYDDDPTQRTVRIVGIQEAAVQPSDHGTWGDSLITLNLVEV